MKCRLPWMGVEVFFVSIIFSTFPSFAAEVTWELVSDSERIEVIEFLLAEGKQNYNRINTWEGEYQYQTKRRLEPEEVAVLFARSGNSTPSGYDGKSPLIRISDGIIHFAIDMNSDSINTSFRSLKQYVHDATSGHNIDWITHLSFQRSIVTPKHFLMFEPRQSYSELEVAPDMKPSSGPVAFCRPSSERTAKAYGMIVDPRKFLGTNLLGQCWKDLENFRKMLQDNMLKKNRDIQIEIYRGKDADQRYFKTIFIGKKPSRTIKQRTVYEEVAGYNRTEFYESEPSGLTHKIVTWDYKTIDNIHVPSKVNLALMTKDGQHISFERFYVLKSCILNKPISTGVFTYQGLGLPDNARVVDEIDRRVYIYRDGKLVQPVDFYSKSKEDLDAGDTKVSARLLLTIITIVLLTAVVIHFIRRRVGTQTV